MSWIEALILGLVQGLTEFLPVSSSGHLTIGQEILNLNTSVAENIQFDITVHAATVLSTICILWHEIEGLFKGTFMCKEMNEEKMYVAKICVSMIPIFVVGIFFKDTVEAIFGEGLFVVGCCLLVTAALLAFSYYAKPRQREDISFLHAFIIGVAQAIAVLPGLSRSGSTIATGLLLGNKKEKVAQFSFLMVLVPILGEAFLSLLKILTGKEEAGAIDVMPLAVGFLAAFVSGCLACKFMIGIVKKGKLIYFAAYCLVAGALALYFAL